MGFESFISPYPKPGEVIDGKYEIQQMLGEGGMGAVTKAKHLLRRAPVALKFLSPSVLVTPGAVDRFLREAEAASRFESPHVVQITDVCKLPNGAPYLVMEYLEGRDLAAIIEEKGTVEVPRAIHFVLQILRALQAAHAEGIIHRDLKPSNCFVIHRDGDDDFIKLFDFGISKIQKEGETKSGSLTQTNSALGTPLYMSPEQARSPRSVDKRTDLYSTAVILYELLTGWTPYFSEAGELTEILFKLFTAEPHPIEKVRPDLPPALCEVIHRCLARDLDTRPSSAAEMAELLAPFADDRSNFVLDRIRHPPPPRKTAPPLAGAHAEGIEAFHKMSVQAGSLPSIVDRKSIGEAATQISAPPPETSAAPSPAAAPAGASMARDAAPMMKAAASAQTDFDATRNSAMTATQALAEPASTSRFSTWLALGGVGAIAIGVAIFATTRRGTTPLEKDPSAAAAMTATPPAPTQTGATADTSSAGAATTASASASGAVASASASAQPPAPHQAHAASSASPKNSGPAATSEAPQNSGIHQLNDIGRKR